MSPAWLDDLDSGLRKSVEKGRSPKGRAPKGSDLMKATLTHDRFSDPDWLYERKFDGERVLAIKDGRDVRLLTRNDKDASAPYPELVEALARQTTHAFAVDGEAVAFDGAVTSFAKLQKRMQKKDPDEARDSGVEVFVYFFDILSLDGYDLRGLPLAVRKDLLQRAIDFRDPLRFAAHRREAGEAFLKEACEKGWEGLIAKRADAPYRASRSRDWLKFKCARGQELVIGGFTDPRGAREGFGALLVGYYAGDTLHYAGKVGTGFDDDLLARLRGEMDKLARKTSPFAEEVREAGAHFVQPKLVGEIGFTEWTAHGKLRHPRFLGLRRDKAAKDVVREEPA